LNFNTFLTRADDETLQTLLGAKVLRMMRAVDPNGFGAVRQRAILLEQTPPQALLSRKSTRSVLLDLLRPAEAAELCILLGQDPGHPYERLANLELSKAKLEPLLAFFDLEPLPSLAPKTALAVSDVGPAYPLFPHQRRAANQCIEILTGDRRRVLLHMPTGAGKTRTAMNIVAEHLRPDPERTVIWLAHSEELCEQAAAEFEKAWTSLGSGSTPVYRFWGARDLEVDKIHGGFVVVGLGKMNAAVRRNLAVISGLGRKASLVVLDEAHQAIAPTYQLILDALIDPFPDSALLGLSATPGRSWDDVDRDRRLSEFFARQKVTLAVPGYDNPVAYLIDKGYLAKAAFKSLHFETAHGLTEGELQRLQEDLEIPPDALERLALDEQRNLAILQTVEDLARRHKRIIVFSATVEHSDLLAYVLRARGVWARSITGNTAAFDRQTSIDAFKANSDDVRVICNYGVLTTGFDAPRTSAALIARPTASLVLYSQMVGRATRGPQAGGNAAAEIVTVVDSGLPGFGDVAEAFYNWEDVWGTA
jgi:DNA repair protein RadD